MSRIRSKKFSPKNFFSNFYYIIFAVAITFVMMGFIFSLGKIKTDEKGGWVPPLFNKEGLRVIELRHDTNLFLKDNKTLSIQLATTSDEQSLGLGMREKISDGEGMLFVFDTEKLLSFWMKDMKFDIDMLWLTDIENVDVEKNKTKKIRVVHIEKNVSKDSFNYKDQNFSKIYSNKSEDGKVEPARYVLEINANLTDKYDIKIGDELWLEK